jgi:hypothetical protein
MRSSIYITLYLVLALLFCSCVPGDADVDPGDPAYKFLGTWKVSESCQRLGYDVEITRDPKNSAQVLLYNFGNPGPGYDPAVGLVISDLIQVFSQTIGEGWSVSGKGRYQSNGTITWEYTLIIPPNECDCYATYSMKSVKGW